MKGTNMSDTTFHRTNQEHESSSLRTMTPLSATFLQELVAEIDNEQMRGILLGGSYARGDATPYSDVDFACFVSSSYHPLRKRFLYRDNHLISIALKTLEDIEQQLTDPYQALWIIPSFRQGRVLLDKDGSMAQLKRIVEDFTWEPLQVEAIGRAGHILLCDAEFVHKLFGNFWKNNLSGAAYTIKRIFDGATIAMALYHHVFITTDSLYYQQVEEAVGAASPWTDYHRQLLGIETLDQTQPSLETDGKLALYLYRETASLLWEKLSDQRKSVISQVLRLIEQEI
jgi:hypothetical protein